MAANRVTVGFVVFEKYGKCAIIRDIDGKGKTKYLAADMYGSIIAEATTLEKLEKEMNR